ncbi:hypothetical protein Dimus_010986 [Dionaea muscipula]
MAKSASNPSSDESSKPPPAAAAETTAKSTRIYVGGLGETVMAEDLRKTFSKLGAIEGVDIVRTKGRSFAYIDFVPSSDKSLSKLFSTYNGCSWKGGKLKLEKAKEHYLDCLRREWAENVEIVNGANSNSDDADQNTNSSVKAVRAVDLENMQIRLFFPKLRKVKSLPFKGTGKHKYSFQRVDTPAFPPHFCACPEHSEACLAPKGIQVDVSVLQCGEINEEEISMMKSIMNKLFEREKDSTACVGPPVSKQGDPKTLEDSPADENFTDDDDLIINVACGYNHSSSSLKSGKQVPELVNKDKISNRAPTSEDLNAEGRLKTRKRKALATYKKGSSVYIEMHDNKLSPMRKRKRNLETLSNLSEERTKSLTTEHGLGVNNQSTADGAQLQNSVWIGDRSSVKQTLVTTGNLYNDKRHETGFPSFSDSNKESTVIGVVNYGKLDDEACQVKEPDMLSEAQVANLGSNRPVKGTSWLQKSSWTQLVSDANGGAFSISQILPGTDIEKLNLEKTNVVQSSDFHFVQEKRRVANKNVWKVLDSRRERLLTVAQSSDSAFSNQIEQSLSRSDMQRKGGEIEQRDKFSRVSDPSASKPEKISCSEPAGMTDKVLGISKSCPFMRNAASMKQWMSAKAAVSGALKKTTTRKAPGDW